MNPILMKQTAILSAILGGILGILTLIPFVNSFSFLLLMLAVGAIVLVYMKKNDLIGIIDVKEGALFGAITGFVSFIGFSIVFFPIAAILSLIFKGYYSYILYFIKEGFFVLLLIIFFMGILSALMNGFAGLLTIYVYEFLSGMKKEEKEQEQIDFEIKE